MLKVDFCYSLTYYYDFASWCSCLARISVACRRLHHLRLVQCALHEMFPSAIQALLLEAMLVGFKFHTEIVHLRQNVVYALQDTKSAPEKLAY